MSAAAAIFEHVPSPTSIQHLPQFIEENQSPNAKGDTNVADPTPMLRKALDVLENVKEQLSELLVESDEDRAIMREAAKQTYDVARLYYGLHSKMTATGLPKDHPVVAMCEDLAAGLEDVAETAALAGSKAFAIAIAQEIADARTEN